MPEGRLERTRRAYAPPRCCHRLGCERPPVDLRAFMLPTETDGTQAPGDDRPDTDDRELWGV